MTPKRYKQNLHTPKIFILSEKPKKYRNSKFQPPKNDPSLRMYEIIRVSPHTPTPRGCHSMVAAVCIVKQIRTVPGPTLCLKIVCLETLWIRSSPDLCKSDPVPGCLFLSCQSIVETESDLIGSNLCWICAGPKLFEAAEIPIIISKENILTCLI